MANIKGTAANDNLVGTTGNDVINGLGGADTMAGGLGNDVYIVDNIGDIVIENSNEGIDTVQASISYLLTANVENLQLTGAANLNGTGNALNNSLIGNSGNNILDGGLGADTMAGGAGNDTYIVDNVGDVVTESAGAGNDTVKTSIANYTLSNNFENLTLIGAAALNGTGNALDNIITGNAANNTLSGAAGVDTMIGGLGDDTYIVDNAGDIVIENLGEGIDKVQSSVNHALVLNIENLTLTGTANITGTGNDLDNLILGNSGRNLLIGGLGNDTLNGGAGIDTMNGGAGNDTYMVDNLGDIVTEAIGQGNDTVQSNVDYTLGNNVENLNLLGAAIIGTGNALDNIMTGNVLNNVLDGGAGNDTLDGGLGADILMGGLGDDTYMVNDVSALVIESAREGTDMVISSVDYVLAANVENLTLSGTASIDGTGNELNNIITGNSGDNILKGGLGIDSLYGGEGNDVLMAGEVTFVSYNGPQIFGVVANPDYLEGGLGNDTYVLSNSDAGNFYAYRGALPELLVESLNGGIDTVVANFNVELIGFKNVENVTLEGTGDLNAFGDGGNNLLIGNDGNNFIGSYHVGSNLGGVIIGLSGNDTLEGGAGNDTFLLNAGAGNFSTIMDFNSGADKILLNFFPTNSGQLLDAAFVSGAGVTTGDGSQQVIYNSTTGDLYYEDGLNPDAAIQFATLLGVPTINVNDFLAIIPA